MDATGYRPWFLRNPERQLELLRGITSINLWPVSAHRAQPLLCINGYFELTSGYVLSWVGSRSDNPKIIRQINGRARATSLIIITKPQPNKVSRKPPPQNTAFGSTLKNARSSGIHSELPRRPAERKKETQDFWCLCNIGPELFLFVALRDTTTRSHKKEFSLRKVEPPDFVVYTGDDGELDKRAVSSEPPDCSLAFGAHHGFDLWKIKARKNDTTIVCNLSHEIFYPQSRSAIKQIPRANQVAIRATSDCFLRPFLTWLRWSTPSLDP
ncbi:hypothetical protein QBC43DRAFT_329086 [Cladorrhinum sp. PSN259]|nr:hypothetical protein QBC43DRAFT_329086 [Cladorrhinum sp. PSN259]